MRALGVDVGGGRKGLDLVVMHTDRTVVLTEARADLDDVRSVLQEVRPQVVAIDSPPAWNAGARSRRTERQLAELGISTFPTPSYTVVAVCPATAATPVAGSGSPSGSVDRVRRFSAS